MASLGEGVQCFKLVSEIPRNLAPNLTHYLREHTKEDRNL